MTMTMTVPPDPDTTISAWVAEWIRRANEGEPLDNPATFEALCRVAAAARRLQRCERGSLPFWVGVNQLDAALDALAARLRSEAAHGE